MAKNDTFSPNQNHPVEVHYSVGSVGSRWIYYVYNIVRGVCVVQDISTCVY